MKTLVLFLGFLLLVSGCSTKKTPKVKKKYEASLLKRALPKKENPPYKLKTTSAIKEALYDEYKKWYGVKYCYGGTTKNGIDCSAFVQVVYKDAFNLKVPRTTKEQAKVGYHVKKRNIKEGDLVLFKTGWDSRHSGIYIERGNFLHTSTKHGVTISNLNNPYWKTKYWQTRRVLAR
jgi:lipoprotein Spr/probable lipoprotein NlpC